MVKNREELLQVANSNAGQLKAHLRRAVSGFLSTQKVSPEELAYVLGISNAEMRNILDASGNITVDTLSKLLVATDMAVEIKPVGNTPLGGYGKGMPRSGGFPGPNGIPVDENGRPLPPPPGWHPGFMGGNAPHVSDPNMMEVPIETSGPLRDSRGRFAKKTATSTPRRRPTEQRVNNPYMSLGSQNLIDIIVQNIWDGEIDVNNATHEQLAEFVANKERIMRERTEGKTVNAEERKPANVEENHQANTQTNVGGSGALNQFLEMLNNLTNEARNNPQLAETIARLMPQK